jgi:dephospho-CoA kinase
MNKIILSLIGYGGSGKTSATRYLHDTYGFTPFTFSSVIRDYAAAHGIALTKRTDYANTHAEMIKKYGWDYTLNIGLNLPGARLCIDDVRSRKYAERIQQAGGLAIAFDCPTEVRFAHVRNHPDKAKYPATLEAFIQNEREDEATSIGAGLAFETGALMKTADYHVDASGSLEHTFSQLDTIVAALLEQERSSSYQ